MLQYRYHFVYCCKDCREKKIQTKKKIISHSFCFTCLTQVLLRRSDSRLGFARKWGDYKNGFGFLSQEFWIGNEKLSYLTNQKNYELHINITYENGSSCYANYDLFRTTDEFGDYAISKLGNYSGNAGKCRFNVLKL